MIFVHPGWATVAVVVTNAVTGAGTQREDPRPGQAERGLRPARKKEREVSHLASLTGPDGDAPVDAGTCGRSQSRRAAGEARLSSAAPQSVQPAALAPTGATVKRPRRGRDR